MRCLILFLMIACLGGCISLPHGDDRSDRIFSEVSARTGQPASIGGDEFGLFVPEGIDVSDGIAEPEAIELALINNRQYWELLADLEISEADIIQAGQLTNPNIMSMLPVGTKQWELAMNIPIDVLWLRPVRVAAAQLEANRVGERLVQDGLNTVRDVRIAYVDSIEAEAQLELANEGSRLRNEIARIAEARLAAGEVSELDVAAMRMDALTGQQQVIAATQTSNAALERLRFQLGAISTDMPVSTAGWSEIPLIELDVEDLVAEAQTTRPDLRALHLAIHAAEERVRLTRFDFFDIRAILPDLNSDGEQGFEAGPGIQFNVPLFHQNQGATARACAELERLQRQYSRQFDTVSLEVRQAFIQYQQAREQLAVWQEQFLPEAEAAAANAQKALEENGVSLLLVLETTRQLINARQQALRAEANLHRAIVELERSVGRRLRDGLVWTGDWEPIPVSSNVEADPESPQ